MFGAFRNHLRRSVLRRLEPLEDRLTPSWAGIPPTTIALPTTAAAVNINAQGAAQGSAAISSNEVDYYSFTAPTTGSYRIDATTPTSNLDTVMGVFSPTGARLGYNDDISTFNLDSRVTVNMIAGSKYYFGITNYTGSVGGLYTYQVTRQTASTPTPPPTTPPTTPSQGGFTITIRATGMNATQLAIFNQAAARWSQIITGDLPNATYQGVAVDDVLIDASAAAIDGAGGILGQAGPDSMRQGSRLPIHGEMEFDSADMARMQANGTLLGVITHEMGHVLGIGTIWQQDGLLTGAGTTEPRFTGSLAAWAYNNLFNTSVTSVPVEGRPSPQGSRDAHWRESTFSNELMTPYINGATNPISTVTVASLADLGYVVNMAAADAFVPTGSGVSGGSSGGTGSGSSPIVQGRILVPPIGAQFLEFWFDRDEGLASALRPIVVSDRY